MHPLPYIVTSLVPHLAWSPFATLLVLSVAHKIEMVGFSIKVQVDFGGLFEAVSGNETLSQSTTGLFHFARISVPSQSVHLQFHKSQT